MNTADAATSYSYVNKVLNDLLQRVQLILGDALVGMYLYGSLAAGDFDPRRSDIDFVVMTRDQLPPAVVEQLGALHLAFANSNDPWARKLEGKYIPLHELRRFDPQGPQLPTVNEKRFFLAGQGSDWIFQRYTLREHEAIVAGPSLRDLIEPIGPSDVRRAARAIVAEWWAPMIADPSWLADRPDYQAFAVQTMCRVLYALEFGRPGTKTAAAEWAIGALDAPWPAVVREAIDRNPDEALLGVERTVAFIDYVTTRIQKG